MRMHRTLALGAVVLALVVSACAPGEGGSPSAAQSPAASQPAEEKPAISMGSAAFYESAVVAEIYAQALEANGYQVERHLELGERDVVQAAFESGDINMAPEYLGGLGTFLGAEGDPDPQVAFDNMQDALATAGFVAFDYSPGSDSDGFAVTQETADQHSLTTLTDIAAVADQLVWGLAPGCPDNPVCGPGLNEIYGIDISQLQVESLTPCSTEMAQALNAGAIDVAQVCTTQPDIQTFNLVLLEDDGGLQPAQNMVPIATQELADAAPADFAETLNAVTALLTTEELTALGVQYVNEQMSFEDIASQWLADNGLS
jgi:osmoprotectant transport system substrate-binding protein